MSLKGEADKDERKECYGCHDVVDVHVKELADTVS